MAAPCVLTEGLARLAGGDSIASLSVAWEGGLVSTTAYRFGLLLVCCAGLGRQLGRRIRGSRRLGETHVRDQRCIHARRACGWAAERTAVVCQPYLPTST